MITLSIPGSQPINLEHLVADFSGTLSEDGILLPGVEDKINVLSQSLSIHVLTADTHGKARTALSGINGQIHILSCGFHDEAKESYVRKLGGENVIAFGNGNNDRLMLAAAKIGVAVCLSEGVSVNAVEAADILVKSISDGLDLLLKPDRLVATLRS